jgi:prevent-host-death family protein
MGTMKTVKSSETKIDELVEQASRTNEPIRIETSGASAVLVSVDEWRAIQETLHLLSIPGMRDSIREGLATPAEDCSDTLEW